MAGFSVSLTLVVLVLSGTASLRARAWKEHLRWSMGNGAQGRRFWLPPPLQRRIDHRDAPRVHANCGADVGDGPFGDVGPGSTGVSAHRRVGNGQDPAHVVAGEEETAAERHGAGAVIENRVAAERDV